MKYFPGDIVIIKNIVFENNSVDHCQNGRPCLVLFSEIINDEEIIRFLPITSKVTNYHFHNSNNQYTILDFSNKLTLVNFSYVYKAKEEDAVLTIKNIDKDYFRIIKNFKDYYTNSNSPFIKKCIEKMSNLEEERELVTSILLDRSQDLRMQERIHRKRNNISTKEDEIGKTLVRKKISRYKLIKEEEKCIDIC